jgi:hypothetical protein
LNEQTCTDDQNHRQRDLRDHECAAGEMTPGTGRAIGAVLQRCHHAARVSPRERPESEEQRSAGRKAQPKQENGPIDRQLIDPG